MEKFLKRQKKEQKKVRKIIKANKNIFYSLFEEKDFLQLKNMRERLIITLLFLLNESKYKNCIVVNSREDLGKMALMTRENVSRLLSEFEKKGMLIITGKEILISDISKLWK